MTGRCRRRVFIVPTSSISVSVETLPSPPLASACRGSAGMMISTFVPRLAISRCTDIRWRQGDGHADDGADSMMMPEHGQACAGGDCAGARGGRTESSTNRKLARDASPHFGPELKTRQQFFPDGYLPPVCEAHRRRPFVDIARRMSVYESRNAG